MNEIHYILTRIGLAEVDDLLEKGYKIIGRYKLYNPRSRLITSVDAQFIAKILSHWLKSSYPQKIFGLYSQTLTADFVLRDIKYVFTLLYSMRILERDFYCLKLVAIYILVLITF